MSSDTDYVITIKGKDAALRKAAADFIGLSLSPWNPSREDKKTLTRLDVFRNESNCAGFFAPSSLCEEAAKLFPGANVSFSSKDEYGYTQEGEWIEKGQAPGNVETAVAEKVFERIRAEVEHPNRQVKWLTPLVEWMSDNKPAKKIAGLIHQTLTEAQAAEREVKAQLEAEAERESQRDSEATEKFESMTRWRFHPALTVENELLGELEKPALWKSRSGWLDKEESVWGAAWEPCKSGDLNTLLEQAIEDECESLAVGLPIKAGSKGASKFLDSQTYEALGYTDSPRILVRTGKGVEAASAKIIKYGSSFVWLNSVHHVENSDFKAGAKKAMHLAGRLEGASVWKIVDEKVLRKDKQALAQEIGGCLALNQSRVFFATNNSSSQDVPSGRILCASVENGEIQWTSVQSFSFCRQLVLSDSSTLLAICIEAGSPPFLICLDSATGEERWRAGLEKSASAFQIAASPEYAALLSYNDESKAKVSWWKTSTGQKVNETEPLVAGWDRPELVMDDLRTYVAARSWVEAFNSEGDRLWNVQLPDSNAMNISLAGDNRLVVSRGDQGAVCLHCETGAMAWTTGPDFWTSSNLTGNKDTVFFASAGMCAVRDLRSGSLLRQIKIEEENLGATPVATTDQFVLLRTGYDMFGWFRISDGEKLGAYRFSAARSLRADGVMTSEGALLCIGSAALGDTNQLICVDLGIGSPSGAWPMNRQGPGGSAFLRVQEKQGYKQFIATWKAKEDMSPRLARLGVAPEESKANIGRIHGIIRGHEMVAQAKLWAGPSIGAGDTAPLRGAQWRLVMAYGGFELLAKSLTATKEGGLEEKTLSDLIGKLSLPNFDALVPPSIDKPALKKWMEEEDASDVLDFLKMENGDRKRFDGWLAKQRAVETWSDAVLLAKALRSATVHGALSPTKIDEWKIGDAVSRLTDEIFRLDEAVFEVLGRA